MTSLFSSCFGRSKDSTPLPSSSTADYSDSQSSLSGGDRPVDAVNPAKCIFCNVTPDRFNIVLEDADYICFTDRSPAAASHLLVVPRTHIANVQSLRHQDVQLVRDMQALGGKALDIVSTHDGKVVRPGRRFGFHIPPFRSVDHLHLHCLELPFRSTLKSLKYRLAKPSSPDYYKGWSWFAEWQQTCGLLEAGKKVKVASC